MGLKDSCKEKDILDFIIRYMTENGFAPSNREIGDGVGLKSTASIKKYLDRLEINGKIKMNPYQPRAISVAGYEFRKAVE